MFVAPLLASFLNEIDFQFTVSAFNIFGFTVSGKKTLRQLGKYRGKLSVVIADAVRTKDKMNLAEAYELLCRRDFEETEYVLNRMNYE